MSYEEEDTRHIRERDMAPTSLSSPITFKLQKKNVEKKPNREKKTSFPMLGSLTWGGGRTQ